MSHRSARLPGQPEGLEVKNAQGGVARLAQTPSLGGDGRLAHRIFDLLRDPRKDRQQVLSDDPGIRYVHQSIEDLQSEDAAFDLVVSSMALHYVDDYAAVVRKVFAALRPGGRFVFSVEHPVCTAHPAGWVRNAQGEALYWPLDDYQRQGRRSTAWFVDGVVKFHRTVEHYVNTLIERGFRLEHLGEPRPLPACLAERPALQETMRRPPVLLLAACR